MVGVQPEYFKLIASGLCRVIADGLWVDRLTTDGTSSPRTGQAHHERGKLTMSGKSPHPFTLSLSKGACRREPVEGSLSKDATHPSFILPRGQMVCGGGLWFDKLTTNGTGSPRTGQAHHERKITAPAHPEPVEGSLSNHSSIISVNAQKTAVPIPVQRFFETAEAAVMHDQSAATIFFSPPS